MNFRRISIMTAPLLVAAAIALPVTAAHASGTSQTATAQVAADSCSRASADARAWLKKLNKPTTGSWSVLRSRIYSVTDGMWSGATKQAGVNIATRLTRLCR
ncbi:MULTISPECIES: hypothetical protein [Streptosporangium]|uniref:Secreted protein n=1 Tax=Streptosporangium brasiliense TaxID=47480 RepID=A0ABT9RIK1_9ACTN|nr:hypothetical protein [Streptosporangium brasiliense]MDP9869127.1 hypothetical protein [Streptosporangium brasiliense]